MKIAVSGKGGVGKSTVSALDGMNSEERASLENLVDLILKMTRRGNV